MSTLFEVADRLAATYTTVAGHRLPARFARPDRTRRAVRTGVGITIHPWGVLEVAGDDRRPFLEDTLTCRLPEAEGAVTYGYLLDPDGQIEADLYVAETGERYLCLTGPGTAASLAETLGSRTFIQEVTVTDRTPEHAVIGVHGPTIRDKLASVRRGGSLPDDRLDLSRLRLRETGVTAVALDAPIGEPGAAVIARDPEAGGVLDALVSLGSPAVPFGYETWLALTLEAGTPLLETELAGRQANVCGQIGEAVDLTKGCFVGQEVVARVANLAEPRARLVGLHLDGHCEAPAALYAADEAVGEVTRVATGSDRDRTLAFGVVSTDAIEAALTVEGDGPAARVADLPFVEGSATSGRIPRYRDRPTEPTAE